MKIDEKMIKIARYAKLNEDLFLKIFNDEYIVDKLAEAAAVMVCRSVDVNDDIDNLIEIAEEVLEDEEAILAVKDETLKMMMSMFGL